MPKVKCARTRGKPRKGWRGSVKESTGLRGQCIQESDGCVLHGKEQHAPSIQNHKNQHITTFLPKNTTINNQFKHSMTMVNIISEGDIIQCGLW